MVDIAVPVVHDVLSVAPASPLGAARRRGPARAEIRADEEEDDGHVEHHHDLEKGRDFGEKQKKMQSRVGIWMLCGFWR